jgi:hypothetical protein
VAGASGEQVGVFGAAGQVGRGILLQEGVPRIGGLAPGVGRRIRGAAEPVGPQLQPFGLLVLGQGQQERRFRAAQRRRCPIDQ